jgi:hypothetical protein
MKSNTITSVGFLPNAFKNPKSNFKVARQNKLEKIALLLLATISLNSCSPDSNELNTRSLITVAPENVAPINGRSFTANETAQAITFRWTPVVPKPQEPVTYKLKVWQLMQGQNSTQAMRSNQPIVTKDVDNITEVAVEGIYTGPCRPPYLCDFVWVVQAVSKNGTPIGTNDGTSNPFVFNF